MFTDVFMSNFTIITNRESRFYDPLKVKVEICTDIKGSKDFTHT